MSAGGIVNSLVGKSLGDDGMERYIETYHENLQKLVQRHKQMRGRTTQQNLQQIPVTNRLFVGQQ